MQARRTICFTDLLISKMGRHRTLDIVGREWRVSLPPFGETIEFLKRGHKFEARWHQGIFLGAKDNTEKIVGNASGVFTVQSIRRRSADDRYDVETLMSITGVPWDPQATKLDEAPLPRIVDGDQQPSTTSAGGKVKENFETFVHHQA